MKHDKPGKFKYYLYAMVRSGHRDGRIKQINIKELSDLSEVTLTDDPIAFDGGTLQVQLVIGKVAERN